MVSDKFNELNNEISICIVGLPLAVAFSEKFSVVGFDINPLRNTKVGDIIEELKDLGANLMLDKMSTGIFLKRECLFRL